MMGWQDALLLLLLLLLKYVDCEQGRSSGESEVVVVATVV